MRGGWKEGGGGARLSCGGREERRREFSHEFTAWLNIVNYWVARAMTDSSESQVDGHGQTHDFSITFRLITRGI